MAKAKVKQLGAAKKNTTRKKTANDGMREFAFMLYLKRVPQNEIADRCDVTIQTITAWKKADNWDTKRAAKTISIDQILAKLLNKINDNLDDPEWSADEFSKSVARLKELKNGNTVDDDINCLMAFQDYLLERRTSLELDGDFIKKLGRLHDMFIQNRMGNVKN